MTDPLIVADEAARRDALDVTRSFIVQAPAGSGKTELLIQRYLRLLSIVEQPEEIVAITFTRKAASEMRARIAAALREAEAGQLPTEPHRQITFEAAARALQRNDDRRWNLLVNPRRLRIQTLDAFNSGVARFLPLVSGLGGIGRVVADTEMQKIYEQAAAATLDWLDNGGDIGRAAELVLAHLDNNVGLYISYLSKMLASRDQWLRFLGSGLLNDGELANARSRLEQGIREVIDDQLRHACRSLPDELCSQLPALLSYAAVNLDQDGKLSPPLQPLLTMQDVPGPDADELALWQALTRALLTDNKQLRKRLNKNNGFPPGDDGQKARMEAILAELAQVPACELQLARVSALPPVTYTEVQWRVLVALFRLLPVTVAELRRIFGARAVCDHIEVAIAANEALGSADSPGDIAMMLDYRIQHLLVDEMQDTSLGQYRLLEQLTAGWSPDDGRTLFCVGDPMQSIYRFRDAEVGQFVIAREQGLGTVRTGFLLLRQNFRSGAHLVHWFNTVFSQLMSPVDDVTAGAIAYAQSAPAEVHAGSGDVALHPLIDCDATAEATYTAALIASCRQENPGDSVAVLVRGRTQLTELLVELRRREVPVEAIEIDRLTDLPEIIDLLALTRALCHCDDRAAWLGLLHGPMVGLSWRDILAVVANDGQSVVRELAGRACEQGLLGADAECRLRRFISTMDEHIHCSGTESLRERVERCWYALGGPASCQNNAAIDNVYAFLDVIERLEVAGTLADIRDLESRLDQEHVSSIPNADNPVRVMTMHKAKGLQFDHVFLYALGRPTRGNQKSVLSWLNLPDEHGSEMIISPVGPRADVENDPLHRFIETTENDKQLHELDRLLYVACTRAKKSLHLVAAARSNSRGDSLLQPRSGTLLSRLWPLVAGEFETAFAESGVHTGGDDNAVGAVLAEPISRRFARPFTGFPAPDPPPLRPAADEGPGTPTVEFYWVGTFARYAGTIVHRWLHRAALAGDLSALADSASIRRTSERWARELGVPDGNLADVLSRVEQAIEGIRGDARGRWLVQGEGYAELALSGLWHGSVTSVIIDRVRIDNGVHWVVDYKTSSHEGGDVDRFLGQEAARYRDQLRKYAAVYGAMKGVDVKTALYFPLLCRFLEVDTSPA